MSYPFNIGLARFQELVDSGATFKMLLLKAAASEATLKPLDTVAAILANGSTTEADFTNYARKTLTVSKNVDDTGHKVEFSFQEVTFTAAGGTTDNNIIAAVIYAEGTNDSDSIPMCLNTVTFTTNGNDVKLNSPAGGFHYVEKKA